MQEQGLPLELTSAELDKYKHRKDDDAFVTVSDQLIALLLKQKKRPVVFATTVYNPEQYGYPLKLSGMVYEIGEGDVDIERTKDLLHNVLSYEKLFSAPSESLSVHIQNLADNYAAVAFHLSMALGLEEGNREALDELDFAIRFSENPFLLYNKARAYIDRGEKEVADSILKALLKIPTIDVEFKKEIAQAYHDAGMRQQAIKLLAECLEMNPDDEEIPGLIRQYQEEK
jgi:tetratricopeptide (TPR) repeat protein